MSDQEVIHGGCAIFTPTSPHICLIWVRSRDYAHVDAIYKGRELPMPGIALKDMYSLPVLGTTLLASTKPGFLGQTDSTSLIRQDAPLFVNAISRVLSSPFFIFNVEKKHVSALEMPRSFEGDVVQGIMNVFLLAIKPQLRLSFSEAPTEFGKPETDIPRRVLH